MNQNCPQCQAANPASARFCHSCGATLAAATTQGRTVVAPSPTTAPTMSPVDAKTIVQRAQQTFGTGLMNVNPAEMTRTLAGQREHTDFAVDISGSMGGRFDGNLNKLEAAVNANITMVLNKAQIDPDDEIGLVVFDHNAETIQSLCPIRSHKRQIIQALQALTSGGGTDINEGLKAAQNVFDWSRNDIVRRIVLLTDGHGGHPLHTAEELKSRGVVIDVIGVGEHSSEVDEKLLRKVASVIEGEVRYRFIKDQQTLVAHYTQLANKTATCA